MPPEDTGATGVVAGLRGESAGFETKSYEGHYEGTALLAALETRRFRANAVLPAYRIVRNGLAAEGLGDVLLQGGVVVLRSSEPRRTLGVDLGVSLPTGEVESDLGMGHVMVMPSLWGAWRAHPLTIMASAGYGRAMTALGSGHHDHGLAPLVDPMNLQELTWSASADLDVGHGVQVGGRTLGGVPIGTGHLRAIGGGRVAWGTPRITTAFELQLGIAGDPFTIRGVAETSLHF